MTHWQSLKPNVRRSDKLPHPPTVSAIVDEWAPVVIVRRAVDSFQRYIERGEELIVVAVEPAGAIIGFGSIVAANSELRAVYVDAACPSTRQVEQAASLARSGRRTGPRCWIDRTAHGCLD